MKKTDKEINDFITEYRGFLIANHIDIAHSLTSDSWFVYRYEPKYGHYEYFIRFATVSQLIDIILDEMKFELYCAIEKEISSPECEDHELSDRIEHFYKKGIPFLSLLLS